MPSRGRHQTTSKECRAVIRRIQALDGVTAVIIGRSYGGKSLGSSRSTGAVHIQRSLEGGLKAVTQSSKGLQELYIQTAADQEEHIAGVIRSWD